jgi:hypothetical protein
MNRGGLYAYDATLKRSFKISHIEFKPDNHFKKTENGIVVISDSDEYLIIKSDTQKWQEAQRPNTY